MNLFGVNEVVFLWMSGNVILKDCVSRSQKCLSVVWKGFLGVFVL